MNLCSIQEITAVCAHGKTIQSRLESVCAALHYERQGTVIDKHRASQYSPLSLAFLGDAVYEQLVRQRLMLTANMPPHSLHDEAVKRVRAEYQARAVRALEDVLTEEERDIIRRGRNASGGLRHVPKSSDRAEYGLATGFEALFGWLRLIEDNERINTLFDHIWERNETGQ